MKLIVIWGFLGLLMPLSVFSQCPVSDFDAPVNVCLNEQIKLDNTSLNSVAYEWFFCNTDYTAPPSSAKIISDFGAVYYSKIIQHNGDTFLFFVSQTLNKLVGLRLTDVASLSYVVHCEIDISGMIINPAGLDLIYENGTWIALATNIVAPFKLIRLVLDDDLKSIETFDDLSSNASLATPFQIELIHDKGQYFAFITNSTAPLSQQLIRLSFGSSMSNAPLANYIGLPVSGQAASMAFHRGCDEWAAFVSLRNGKIMRVNFGTDLAAATPVITDLTLDVAIDDPGGLSLVEDHEKLVMVIQSRNGNVYTGTIESILDNTVDVLDFGDIKASTRDWGIEVYRFEDDYKIITANFTNGGAGGFYDLNFSRICPGTARYSKDPLETLSFHEAGTFKVTLKAKDAESDSHSFTREIVVSTSPAPQLTVLNTPEYCINSSAPFSFTSDLSVTAQTWEFGDGAGFSSDHSPDYSYANAGTFTVLLNVTANNGCKNFEVSPITIYSKPQADFTLPPNLLCTNNEFLFPTTTPDTYNGNLSYQWFVEDTPVSTTRDLQHTFTTTGPKDIKLVTSIPGCSNEITKTTASVQLGPVVDFSVTGACEGEVFSFQNEISDPVETYQWDFDNGNTSGDPNPTEQFASFGDYSVSLTATNAIGCESVKTRVVAVHSKPVVDFSADGPPNACAGTSTRFTNLTTNPDGGEITQWLWDFNDANDTSPSSSAEPEHIFALQDTYPVALTATTASGCVGTGNKNITIYASPSTDFQFTPTCHDVPVLFTGPPDANIIDSYWEIGTSYYEVKSPTHTFKAAGEFPLYLEVTAANGCIAEREQTIHVPEPLTPDFSVLKNCIDEEAIFTNVTTGSDAVVATQWLLNEAETFTDSPLRYRFTEPENQQVTMSVTTVSGCEYAVSKSVEIFSAPQASFSSTPQAGAYPLQVKFTNNSRGATHYQWDFADGSGAASAELSPVHTFQNEGSFEVVLTALNAQECADSFTDVITTVAPLPDASVEQIILTPEADGSLKLIVTVRNKGNSVLVNAPLEINFSGNLVLRHILTEPILPTTKYNFVFNTGIVKDRRLRYLCVSLEVENDLHLEDNRFCEEFDDKLLSLPAYPNPAISALFAEWISETASAVRISLLDAMGRSVLHHEMNALEGINRQPLDVSGLRDGIYYLLIEDGLSKNYQRILVMNED